MKTIGQTYPLSEFEPGDVGEWCDNGPKFVFKSFGEIYQWGKCSHVIYAHGDGLAEPHLSRQAVYLGRGRIEPARIVMEEVK